MNNRKIIETFLVLLACVLAVILGKTLATAGALAGAVPLVLLAGIYLGFRYKRMLPAIVLGMAWYFGGSPFIKDIPYVFYVCAASLGIALLNRFMRKDHEYDLRSELPVYGKVSLLALALPLVIFIVITALKHNGVLPAYNYGVAGGVRRAGILFLTVWFAYYLMSGRLPQSRLKYIPHVALAIAIFTTVIDTMNYISPQTAFITWYLTTSINFEVMDVLRGSADSVLRLSGLRELGMFGALFLMARYINEWKQRNWRHVPIHYLLGLGVCGLIILFGGFRNVLIRYVLVLLVFFWMFDKRWAIMALVLGGVIWGGAIGMGDQISVLPLPVQRVVGSLPGVYQSDVAYEAMGGLAWREELRSRFWDNEFWRHPWFGRAAIGDFFVATQSAMADRFLFFEVTQLWHSGLASTLDMVGVVGATSFLIAQLLTLVASIRLLAKYKRTLEGWMFWCVAQFYASNIIFWYNGFFGKQVPIMALSMVGVWLVYAVLKKNARELSCDDEVEELVEDVPEEARVS